MISDVFVNLLPYNSAILVFLRGGPNHKSLNTKRGVRTIVRYFVASGPWLVV